MIHGDLSADLLRTIFSPRSPLHDGAVIVRGARNPRRGRGPAAERDDDPVGAIRHAPPGGARAPPSRPTRSWSWCPRRTATSATSSGRGSCATSTRASSPAPSVASWSRTPIGARLRHPGGGSGSGSYRLPDIGRAVRTARRNGAGRPASSRCPPDEPMLPEPPAETTGGGGPPAGTGRRSRSGAPPTEPVAAARRRRGARDGGRDTRPRSMTRILGVRPPQLAAQARRDRPRHAAVRRSRPVPDDPGLHPGSVPDPDRATRRPT